jgi:hypothetical protein
MRIHAFQIRYTDMNNSQNLCGMNTVPGIVLSYQQKEELQRPEI